MSCTQASVATLLEHPTKLSSLRIQATGDALWSNLHIVPLAIGVALIGALVLRCTRSRVGVANDLWLWLVVAGSLVTLSATYVFGALEIHWWLSNSANRTTIFACLAAYADLAIWLIVASAVERSELVPVPAPAAARGVVMAQSPAPATAHGSGGE